MSFRGMLKCVSGACCVCCLSLCQSTDAMRTNVGYYGDGKEVDYSTLDVVVTNCVAGILYGDRKFPGECVKEYLDVIFHPDDEMFLPYLNESEFEKFCAEQHRKWSNNELISDSIKKCESIYRDGNIRKRVSVYILLKETLNQLEFESRKQSSGNGR